MQYYLRHYFNPDFDYLRPKPGIGEDGESSDLYSLGYVQNVIAGQLLAEVIPLEQAGAEPDPRFVLSRPVLPGGANTRVDPAYPNYLLSTSNGYVFYNNGKITVKRLLNVRQDVSFRTGNIFFVGDMAVHGSVRSGFSVQANNLRIMGMVEGGVARARRDLMVDGGARGGAALSIRSVTGAPVKFVGVGEKLSEMEVFHPDRIAGRILGMGDVLTLVEKAQSTIDAEEAEALARKMQKASFDLEDFRTQMRRLKKLGSLDSILKMIPGLGGLREKLAEANGAVPEKEMARTEAIINSMTMRERRNPDILNGSRRARIAKGAGVTVAQVNQMVRQFEQMRQMMKGMMGGKGAKGGRPAMPKMPRGMPPGMMPPGMGMPGMGGFPGMGGMDGMALPGGRPGGAKSAAAKKRKKKERQKRKKK